MAKSGQGEVPQIYSRKFIEDVALKAYSTLSLRVQGENRTLVQALMALMTFLAHVEEQRVTAWDVMNVSEAIGQVSMTVELEVK